MTRNAKPPLAGAMPTAISGGRFCEVLLRARIKGRAKSWTLRSVADAKRSATGNSRVASCPLTPSCLVDDSLDLRGGTQRVQGFSECLGGLEPTFLAPDANSLSERPIFGGHPPARSDALSPQDPQPSAVEPPKSMGYQRVRQSRGTKRRVRAICSDRTCRPTPNAVAV